MERALTLATLSLLLLACVAFQEAVRPPLVSTAPAAASAHPAAVPAPTAAPAAGDSDGGASPVGGTDGGQTADSAAPFPAESVVGDSRGFWLSDWSKGKVAQIDRGPRHRQSVQAPIFMYHNVRPIDFKTTNAFVSDLTLPPTEFEAQLRYLKGRGISTVTMGDVYLHLEGRLELPPRSVVLTFDDGFENNYLYALPLLKKYGYVGTFYIISGFIGRNEYMTWREAQELVSSHMEIGSHTVSHPDMAKATAATRDSQLVESRAVLEGRLGVSVRTLSYPAGAYDQDTVAAAKKAGYLTAVTTRYGTVLERRKIMELPRVRIHGTDQMAGFRSRLEQIFPSGGAATS